MPLSQDDVAAIETVAHYTHDEDQAYCMLYGSSLPLPRARNATAHTTAPAPPTATDDGIARAQARVSSTQYRLRRTTRWAT